MHEHWFLMNIAIATTIGLLGGLAARLLGLPVLVGYLVAGIIVGPHTPGIFAEADTVRPVANLGVILLMFAVGVQFSLRELKSVKRTAIIGGGSQILGTIVLGTAAGLALGWGFYGALFLGCAISLSSTAVLVRMLEERGETGSGHGKVMLGISVVQDLSLVLMVALLPSLGSLGKTGVLSLAPVGLAAAKASLFLAGTLFLSMRGVPVVLHKVSRLRSRELFVLTVVVMCLGAAICAELAGLGPELGAFLAGIVISESDYAHEVFSQVRPLRDVFACLFFVSVGMLLNPQFMLDNMWAVGLVAATILVGKAIATAIPVYLLGWDGKTALFAGIGLAQIGEFSFVLASLGNSKGLIDANISNVILSSALVTILLAPFTFQAAGPFCSWMSNYRGLSRMLNRQEEGQIIAIEKQAASCIKE